MITFFAFGNAYAENNPKLLKEIKRKIFLDLSKVDFSKSQKDFVIVKFKVTNHQIEIVDIEGSRDKLTKLMMKELKEMVIQTDAKSATTYQYKFNFEKE
jgi:hypothetical protein